MGSLDENPAEGGRNHVTPKGLVAYRLLLVFIAVFLLCFPGPYWAHWFGLIPMFDAIVHVAVTYGAESFVVEADGPRGLLQLFREVVDGLQVIGRSWDFGFCGL